MKREKSVKISNEEEKRGRGRGRRGRGRGEEEGKKAGKDERIKEEKQNEKGIEPNER